jgi:tetratricopeptide (TPR) repeat protein
MSPPFFSQPVVISARSNILPAMKALRILCLVVCGGALAASCSRDPQALRDSHFQKGEAYFKEGKLAEATVEFRTALQYDARMGAAYFKLGEISEKRQDGLGAVQAYVRAADLMPKDVEAHIRAANYLMAAQQFEDARTVALKAVALDPKNVEALILVGNASAGLNNLERAIEELQAAQKLDAADPRIFNNLGWFEALQGRSDRAEAIFRNAVAVAPKSAAAHLALANYLGAKGKRDEAEKSLRTAVAVEPSDVPALRAIGWFLTVTNRGKEAEPFLVDAARYDPKPDSRMLLADFYVWSGRDADAVRVLEQLKSKEPGSVLADTRLASIFYRTDPPRAASLVKAVLASHPENADAQLLSAQLAFDARKLTEALSALEHLTTQYPRLAAAHFLNGRVLVELGRFSEAAKAFNEVVTINPRAVPARLYLARLELLNNQAANARQIANEVLKLAPGNPAARLAIVQADRVSGKLADANRQIADLARSYPDWPPVHYEAARLAIFQSDWPTAGKALDRIEALEANSREAFEGRLAVDVGRKDFKSAIQRLGSRLAKAPDDQRVLLVAGQVYLASGDQARAERAWKMLLAINPDNNDAYDALGRMYADSGRAEAAEQQFATLADKGVNKEKEYGLILAAVLAHGQGKLDVAKQRYEKELALNPQAAVAANNLAWIYAEEGGNLDVALNLAQTAKRAEPDNPNFSDTLGFVLLKKGLAASAIPEFQAAVNKSPKNATIQLHLAQAFAADGQGDNARMAAQKALAIDPAFPEASEARAIVEGRGKPASPPKGG